MTGEPLLFIIFILAVFLLLTLLPLTMDLLNRLLVGKEIENLILPHPIKAQIEDIFIQLNSHEFSHKQIDRLTNICPVEAISSVNEPESFLKVSAEKCLGYSCLKCLEKIEVEN